MDYYSKVRFPAPYPILSTKGIFFIALLFFPGMTVPCPCLLLVENTVLTITHGRGLGIDRAKIIIH